MTMMTMTHDEIQSKVTDTADAMQKKWLSHSLYNLPINCSKNTDNVSPDFLPFLRDIEIFQDTWTSTNFFLMKTLFCMWTD